MDAEFVVAASQVLDECVAADNNRGGAVGLETATRSEPGLEPAMVGLDAIVRVRRGHVFSVCGEFIDDA